MDKKILINNTAIVSVINDLTTEQRVHKVCIFLLKKGYDVTLVGRNQRGSLPLASRPYKTKRIFLFFEKGPLFYAEYNFRLFLFLLFRKTHLVVSNDLDTLLPNFLISKLKGVKLVYDSHEYFTEVPELEGRKFKKKVWEKIERYCFPKLKNIYTVNQSIAGAYEKKYNVKVKVVRNFPVYKKNEIKNTKTILQIPSDTKIILYQGSVNLDRGMEEAIEAMQYVENAVLLIIGDGDVLSNIKSQTKKLKLDKKIIFHNKIPFEQLKQLTIHADIGISLEKDTNFNYHFSLPNKIFDYIHCGVPILSSSLPEIKHIVLQYDVGEMIKNHNPHHIAEKINFMLSNPDKMKIWKENCAVAAKELCWQNEEKILEEIYSSPLK